jgi:hypothetical protein
VRSKWVDPDGAPPLDRHPRGYFLHGEQISTGADGEPILDLKSLKPMSAMTTRQEMLRQFHSINAGAIATLSEQFGICEIALFLLLLGQPSDNWPEQPGDWEAVR